MASYMTNFWREIENISSLADQILLRMRPRHPWWCYVYCLIGYYHHYTITINIIIIIIVIAGPDAEGIFLVLEPPHFDALPPNGITAKSN